MHRASRTLSQPPIERENERPKRAKWLRASAALICGVLALPVLAATQETLQGPDVTIIASEEKTIFEYRQRGELRMVKVVPTWGKPYYLVPRDPTTGFGDLEKADMLLPSWVLFEF